MSKQTKSTKPAKAESGFISDEAAAGGSAAYMKWESGENKIRVISKPIEGWIVWEEDEDGDRKPVRSQLSDGEPDAPSEDPKDAPKKFVTVVVIDRADDEVKILEITQKSIIKAIKALAMNPKWGNPFSYDINVEKKGADKKTRYTVTPDPKSALSKNEIKAANEKQCNLDALFVGENPWEVEGDEVTEYFFK